MKKSGHYEIQFLFPFPKVYNGTIKYIYCVKVPLTHWKQVILVETEKEI